MSLCILHYKLQPPSYMRGCFVPSHQRGCSCWFTHRATETVAKVMRSSRMDEKAQSPPGRLELQFQPVTQAHGNTVFGLAYFCDKGFLRKRTDSHWMWLIQWFEQRWEYNWIWLYSWSIVLYSKKKILFLNIYKIFRLYRRLFQRGKFLCAPLKLFILCLWV